MKTLNKLGNAKRSKLLVQVATKLSNVIKPDLFKMTDKELRLQIRLTRIFTTLEQSKSLYGSFLMATTIAAARIELERRRQQGSNVVQFKPKSAKKQKF